MINCRIINIFKLRYFGLFEQGLSKEDFLISELFVLWKPKPKKSELSNNTIYNRFGFFDLPSRTSPG